MQTDDEVTIWWPITAFDLRLNGSGSVDIRLESWDKSMSPTTQRSGGIPFSRMERMNVKIAWKTPCVPRSMPLSAKPASRRSRPRTTSNPLQRGPCDCCPRGALRPYDLNRERLVHPVKYQKIWSATPEYAIIQQNDLCGLLSPEGEKLTPIKYDWIEANTSARLIRVSMGLTPIRKARSVLWTGRDMKYCSADMPESIQSKTICSPSRITIRGRIIGFPLLAFITNGRGNIFGRSIMRSESCATIACVSVGTDCGAMSTVGATR